MPISDEIIELAPIKKTKSKLAILIVAIAVLFAAAATFLVLYLLKPNVENVKGRVHGVSVEKTSLFSPVSGDDAGKLYASVGNTYTIYVDVSKEGEANTDVRWDISPNNAVTYTAGKDESTGKSFCEFIPTASAADKDQLITISAISVSDNTKSESVSFYAVTQGTAEIKFLQTWESGSARVDLDNADPTLELTYYSPYIRNMTSSSSPNNKNQFVTFEQLGRVGADGEYSKLTLIDANGTSPSNKVSVKSSDESVVKIGSIVENPSSGAAYFSVQAANSSTKPVTITITANENNNNEPVVRTITVNVKPNYERGLTNNIYVFNEPVNKEFLDKYTESNGLLSPLTTLPKQATKLTLSYLSRLDDLLSYVLIDPVTVQYTRTDGEGKLKSTDWYKTLTVTSSNDAVVQVSRDDTTGKVSLVARDLCGLSDGVKITIADKARPDSIKVELPIVVVAQNSQAAEISVKTSGITYNNEQVRNFSKDDGGEGIPTSPTITSDVTITYKLSAPEKYKDKPTDIIEKKMMSLGFDWEYDKEVMIVEIGTSDVSELKLKEYTSKTMAIKHTGGSSYEANVTFKLTIRSNVEIDTVYGATVIKVGTSLQGAGEEFNHLDNYIAIDLKWHVSKDATEVEFVSDDDSAELLASFGKTGYLKNGKLTSTKHDNGKFEYTQDTKLYLQHGTTTVNFLDQLIQSDGTIGSVAMTVANVVPNSALSTEKDGDKIVLKLDGSKSSGVNTDVQQATIKITVKDNAGDTIGNFSLEVYIYDAFRQLQLGESTSPYVTLLYSGKEDGGVYMSFPRDEVNAYRVTGSYVKDYQYPADCIEILYNGNKSKLDDAANGGEVNFSYDGTTVFTYKNGAFQAVVDLFEFSYNNGIDLSRVSVKYSLDKNERYVLNDSGEIPNVLRSYTFKRKVDDINIYTSDKGGLITDLQNDKLVHSIQRETEGWLYPIAVINIKDKDGNPISVINNTNFNGGKAVTVAIEDVYVTKVTGLEVLSGSTTLEHETDKYGSLQFRTPSITEKSQDFTLYVGASTFGKDLIVSVQNQLREAAEIKLYTDENCSAELDSSLVFGNINDRNAANYEKLVYIEVTFKDRAENHVRFEPVDVILPDNFLYKTSSEGEYSAPSDKGLIFTYSADIEVDEPYVFPLFVKLVEDAPAGSCKLTVKADRINIIDGVTDSEKLKVLKTHDITVATGLASLDVLDADGNILTTVNSGDNSENNAISFPFEVTDSTTVPKLTLALDGKTLTSVDGYNDIEFDWKSLVFGCGANVNISEKTDKRFTVSVPDITKLFDGETGEYKPFDLMFTDGKTVFTVRVVPQVTAEIFALGFEKTDYTVYTTGREGNRTAESSLVFNNGVPAFLPDIDTLGNVEVKVYDGASEASGASVAFNADKIGFTLTVDNSVVDKKYKIVATAGAVTAEATVTVKKSIVLDGENDIVPVAGKANIVVDNAATDFKLAAFRNKTDENEVTYALYSDSAYSAALAATVATVSEAGVISFKDTAAANGTVYYRAQDEFGSTIDVAISYTVDIASVQLTSEYAPTDGTIVMYIAANGCAYVDLGGKISVKNAFGADITAAVTVTATSTDSGIFTVAGSKLMPVKAGSAAVTVTAELGATGKSVSINYNIKVTELSPALAFVENTEVNLADDENDEGFDVSFVASNEAGLSYVAALQPGQYTFSGSRVTIDRSKFVFDASSQSNFLTVVGTVTYTASGNLLSVDNGALAIEVSCEVPVKNEYTPEFELQYKKEGAWTEIGDGHVFDMDAEYRLVVTNYKSAWDGYSGEVSRANLLAAPIVFTGGEAAFVFGGEVLGAFDVTVSVEKYGKVHSATKSYAVNSKETFDVSFKLGETELANNETKTVTELDGKDLVFTLDASGMTTKQIDADYVSFRVFGSATYAAITSANNVFSWKIVVNEGTGESTTLQIGCSFVLDGKQYYTEDYRLTLTAIAPEFTSTVDRTSLVRGESVELGVKADGFTDSFTVEDYAIVGGGNANFSANTLNVTNDFTVDKSVAVRMTVKVTSGAFKDSKYYVNQSFDLIAPTVAWNEVPSVQPGGTVDFGNESLVTANAMQSGYTDSYVYSITNSAGLTLGTDYTFTNNMLTVKSTPKTNAGGIITVNVVRTVKRDSKTLTTVSATVDVRIVPNAFLTADTYVSGAIGTYDIGGAVRPYTASGEAFIKATDSYSVTFTRNAGSDFYDVIGDKLIVTKHHAELVDNLTVNAKIVITSGGYKGLELSGTAAIHVYNEKKDVSISKSNYAYVPVDLGTKLGLANGETVEEVTVLSGDESLITVNNLGTGNATVVPAMTAYVNGISSNSDIPLAVTVKSGEARKYYLVHIKPAKITPELNIVGKPTNATVGTPFVVTVTEKHGLDIGEIAVTVKIGQTEQSVGGKYEWQYEKNGGAVTLTPAAVTDGSGITYTVVLSALGVSSQFDVKVMPLSVSVSLNACGGELQSGNSFTAYYHGNYGTLADPTRAGYTFDGWYLDEYYGKSVSDTVETMEAHTLYAKWKASKIEIALVGGDHGTPSPNKIEATFGETYSALAGVRVDIQSGHEGWEFVGWYTVGNELVTADTKVVNASCTQLNAHYAQKKFAVTLVANGGAFEDGATVKASTDVPYGKDVTELYSSVTRHGYTFGGWYNAADGGEKIESITADAMLYAHWTPIKVTLTFVYGNGNANGTKETDYDTAYNITESAPVRSGYVFVGWFVDGSEYKDGTHITSDTEFTAVWNKSFTVHYENGSADKTINLAVGTSTEKIAAQRVGYVFAGWYDAERDGNKIETVTDATTHIYAHWTIKSYTVTLIANGGSFTGGTYGKTVTVGHGGTVDESDAPSRTGYDFAGWCSDAAGDSAVTSIERDITLYAKWNVKEYTITLDSGSGEPSTVRKSFGETYNVSTITKSGYTFVGWFLNNERITSITVTGDITLTARWTKDFTVDYGNGNSDQVSYAVGTSLSVLEIPEYDGYTFTGWYSASSGGQKVETVSETTETVYARREENSYTVTLIANGGSFTGGTYGKTVTVGHGGTVEESDKPSRTGYDFAGWCSDAAGNNAVTSIERDITLYAKWSIESYTVTVVYYQGKEDKTQTVDYGEAFTLPTDTTREGYRFLGWFIGEEEVTDSVVITAETEIVAKWVETYIVTVKYGNGAVDSTSTVDKAASFTLPEEIPTREGYRFLGWFIDENEVTGSVVITGATEISAKWIKTVSVTLHLYEGSTETNTYDVGTLTSEIEAQRDNHSFGGWFTAAEGGDKVETVTETTTDIYAHWTLNSYTVTLIANGGSFTGGEFVLTETVGHGETYALPVVTRDGYTFDGWYIGEQKVEGTISVTADTVLIARWSADDTDEPTV